ncbi:MAG: hypothetical protein ABW220_14855 [Burkholderiaceae bacterium]
MTESQSPATAKAKLALSRSELLAAMGYETVKDDLGDAPERVMELAAPAGRSKPSLLGVAVGKSVVGRWWKRHPLSSVAQLAEPLLEGYAQRSPARLVGYAAGAGALFMLLKPWKLLSVATVATLVLKSSDISAMVSDALAKTSLVPAADRFPALPGSERHDRL